MCTEENKIGSWKTEWPEEEGDYLWIAQWSCGCIRESGIAYVYEVDKNVEDEEQLFFLHTQKGVRLAVSWVGQKPWHSADGTPDVHYWIKIELPPPLEE